MTTAIFKEPVVTPAEIGVLGLDDDSQADLRVHGGVDKAVYAYSAEDYEWWSSVIGRALEPGTFGENLTIAGLDVSRSVVGERWRVGSAVLAVSQPRMPCFKLGIRMGDAAFVKRFGTARRPGAYLRVVTPGRVAAGDRVVVSERPAHGLTVVDIVDAEATGEPARLRRVADTPDVPASWSDHARRRLAAS